MNKSIASLFALSLSLAACDGGGDTPAVTKSFAVAIKNVAPIKMFRDAGVFNTPVGQTDPGAITPGKSYEFTVNAGKSQKLSFVTMLAATNDLFLGPKGEGIALYDEDGEPITANVTDQIYLWDAGTELNEEPAVGPNTVTQQDGPDTGPAENGNVALIGDTDDAFDYPEPQDIMAVTVTHMEGTEFKVNIENVSPDDALKTSEGDRPAPLSPGVWVLHSGMDPLFTAGEPDRGQGLEHIAEDGNPSLLGEYVDDNAGVTYPASPGVWVLHEKGTMPLFAGGKPDYGDGLEHIAEDGNPGDLSENLEGASGFLDGAVFNMPVGSEEPGPIRPGDSYKFSFDASPGDSLSFVTMLAATNDVFFGTKDEGLALFDADDVPVEGDVTGAVYLWDAGTELNEVPSVGPNTVTNQAKPNTGKAEKGSVLLLSQVEDDSFEYPDVDQVLEVTIQAK